MELAIIRRIAAKELALLFSSPIAYLFIGSFLAVTLFIFFWVEAFFARNIADIRPLFEWMPVLLAFLASTITMKMWSEEKRQGTIEFILTQPISTLNQVLGKYFACFLLLIIAIAITFILPLIVSFMADLDWGPVLAGYFATLLLGGTYLAIGLFISSKTDNQIVSLIGSVAICSLLHLIGSDTISSFFNIYVAAFLDFFATGARFESIVRGVIDIRDFWYYGSLILLFLYLNYYSIEKERWPDVGNKKKRMRSKLISALIIANILISNFWLHQVRGLRIDSTAENIYSISDHTKNVLQQLREPLLIKGIFSAKTHPLLAPLIPQLTDLLRELQVGNDNLRVEIIDPMSDPEKEKEIVQEYNIQPVPLQVQDRYQSSVVSIYFNLFFQYGDSQQVLGFNDLIEIRVQGNSDLKVTLRNPEFDIIRTIKKLIQDYQTGNDVFTYLEQPIEFNAYISSDDKLPQELVGHRKKLEQVVQTFADKGDSKFQVNYHNPEQQGEAFEQQLRTDFGIQPMRTNILSSNTFYYYLFVGSGDKFVSLPLDAGNPNNIEKYIEDAIKRFVPGLNKTIAIFNNSNANITTIENALSAEYNVTTETLENGTVNNIADTLFLLAPENIDRTQLFAIDQFLMRGGSIVLATAANKTNVTRTSLQSVPVDSGLTELLNHYGISLGNNMVMDPKNVPFPVPVLRDLGGFQVQEIKMLDYPFFSNIRDDELNLDHPVTSNIPFLTLTWAYPIAVNASTNIAVTELIHSSENSWISSNNDIMPRESAQGYNFSFGNEPQSHLLGVELQGEFISYFKGKDLSPIAESVTETSAISSIIEKSAAGAKILVFSSNDFFTDRTIQLVGSIDGNYRGAQQLLVNSASYLLEDEALLSIRSRKHYNRSLPPLSESERLFWEYFSYGISLVLLIAIALFQVKRYKKRNQIYAQQISS